MVQFICHLARIVIMDIALLILESIVVGLVVGMLSGMLGIGGGTVLVPVFKLLYGMQAIAATATSMFTIIPTSVSGVITHVRNKTVIPVLGVAAGVGGAIMSPVGVWLASISPDWAIMVAAALVIAYSAITMFRKAMALRVLQHSVVRNPTDFEPNSKASQAEPASQDFSIQETSSPSLEMTDADAFTSCRAKPASAGEVETSSRPKVVLYENKRLVGIGFLIGLGAGVMSGYVGVGGGFIMVPLFMQLLGTSMKLTSGTSLIAVMILAIPGTITQAIMGNVDWIAGIMVAVGSIPGAYIGSKLMKRVPELALRFGFSIFLLIAATLLVLNQLGAF